MFKNFIRKKNFNLFLDRASKLIYSDDFIDREIFDDSILINMVAESKNWQNIFLATNAIRLVAQNSASLNKSASIEDIFNRLDKMEKQVKLSQELTNPKETDDYINIFLEIDRLKAGVDLTIFNLYLANGRKAFEQNKDSFEGLRFELEMIKKGPLNDKEIKKWRSLVDELKNAKDRLKDTKNQNRRITN